MALNKVATEMPAMSIKNSTKIADKLFEGGVSIAAWAILAILIGLFGVLIYKTAPAFNAFGFGFILSGEWDAGTQRFGGLFSILGTLISAGIAMILAVPVGLLIAIFLSFIAPARLAHSIAILIELLAAIPSIIYGMWGFLYLVPLIRLSFGGSGVGLLSGGVVLAVMILPFITAVAKDALSLTPKELRESAFALGASRFDMIKDAAFNYAKTGIIGASILALARAFGETMAVAFLIGGIMKMPDSLITPATSIPVSLATQFGEAMGVELHESAMFYLALILMVVSASVMWVARVLFLRKR